MAEKEREEKEREENERKIFLQLTKDLDSLNKNNKESSSSTSSNTEDNISIIEKLTQIQQKRKPPTKIPFDKIQTLTDPEYS